PPVCCLCAAPKSIREPISRSFVNGEIRRIAPARLSSTGHWAFLRILIDASAEYNATQLTENKGRRLTLLDTFRKGSIDVCLRWRLQYLASPRFDIASRAAAQSSLTEIAP